MACTINQLNSDRREARRKRKITCRVHGARQAGLSPEPVVTGPALSGEHSVAKDAENDYFIAVSTAINSDRFALWQLTSLTTADPGDDVGARSVRALVNQADFHKF